MAKKNSKTNSTKIGFAEYELTIWESGFVLSARGMTADEYMIDLAEKMAADGKHILHFEIDFGTPNGIGSSTNFYTIGFVKI